MTPSLPDLPSQLTRLTGAVPATLSRVPGVVRGGVPLDVREAMTSATALRVVMNAYPPFLFAGIRVKELTDDFRHARVELRLSRATANYVGTQYGGSLYSMTDPFWMIMILRNLGDDYVVWDKRGEIEFVAPGTSHVTTSFDLTDSVLEEIREAAAGGEKVLRWFDNDVVAEDGTLVARVRKQVYVRRKRR